MVEEPRTLQSAVFAGWPDVRALLFGFGSGLLVLAVIYVVYLVKPSVSAGAQLPYSSAVTVLFPMIQGFGLAVGIGKRRIGMSHGVALLALLFILEVLGAAIFLHEGVICLIIASPLILGLMGIGAFLGRFIARGTSRSVQTSVVPLALALAIVDMLGPRPDKLEAVSDSVVIDAPSGNVWRYIVSYPENTAPPEYWLWRIGLPEPIQSTAEAPVVGAKRECRFSKGLAFEERIIELTPGRSMTFAVTQQPNDPEALGHFRFDKGQLTLTALPGNRTRLTATSWYHLYVKPYVYFNLWTTDIVRQVHFRVMNRMKALAESDYRSRT